MRRAFTMLAGLALASMASLLTLTIAVAFLAAPASKAGVSVPASLLDLLLGLAWTDEPQRVVRAVIRAACETVVLACCAPVICAACIGEVAGRRGLIWCSGTTVAFSVLLPVAAAGWGSSSGAAGLLASGPLLAAGAVAGAVYWLVAGRDTRVPSSRPTRFDLASAEKSVSEIHDG